ncbi:MAG: hypothetical protein INR69_09140 [Mucilaginibacter polytrichastri]|nr:hypothetical protein [Mucilaginibacter polytrichastri]
MTLQLADNYFTVLTMLPENGGLCYDEIMLMKYKEELRYLKELGFVHSIEVEHLDYFMAAYLTPAGAAYLLDVKTPVAPEVTEQDNVNHELLLKVTRAEAFAIIAVFLSLLGTIISLVNAFRH